MSIYVDKKSKVVVQGATGHQGVFHINAMKEFGTNVVAGVTPGKGGQEVHGVPIFDNVFEAVDKTGANTSLVLVPARFAKDAVFEALDAGCKTIVTITENIPFHDAMFYGCQDPDATLRLFYKLIKIVYDKNLQHALTESTRKHTDRF